MLMPMSDAGLLGSDERIKERLASMTSAKQVVEQLIQDALDGGGTDNITLIVGRSLPKTGAQPTSTAAAG